MIFYNFAEFETNLKNKIRYELLKKKSSQNPTVIYYEKEKQIWLFFFNNGYMKSLWIYDCVKNGYTKPQIPLKITGACLFEGEIFVLDDKGEIYIKKTGSFCFPSC